MYFDKFDIVEAYHLYYTHHYSGMFDPHYIRRCKMESYFRPSVDHSYESLTENGQMIYDNLVETKHTYSRKG